ncbi:hypothetical protein PC9H_009756 [Pleurotus ostreatus]|uniref:Arrestin-like N-terminal domain-containing protein n=2 Tax=Pleurotus TaxID=5320 RepID=A0A8H7DN90_PLEOS|nr:uncharacterized protein PC9H_009756 [Pleurotus ostreatus]KAF7424449.1 hypothetical protein PC9H_009756 [Pleurotus ostreatus]KAG9224888.1 hypothetical protein CCMSSC00406_0001961 [Pleurotus cornucopiae]KAJ8692600.1 hypothetical protein PTI98_009898 [Pleurotus ostreatus]
MPVMQSPDAPPRYLDQGAEQLPEYTSTRPLSLVASRHTPILKEFTYDSKNRKGRSWLSLTLKGDTLLSKHTPTIAEGSGLSGSVSLNLESSEAIQAVSISVIGQIITGANPGESFTFLEIPVTLWSKALGEANPAGDIRQESSGKLLGTYSWPFHVDIPKQVTLPIGSYGSSQTYTLPQTFLERHTRAGIKYDVIVRISRGKLRVNSKLTATFGYLPIIRPMAPSPLRQLAYQENSPILGPEADPEGWHTVPSTWVKGNVFGKRSVSIHCTLSLAKPLCYTRGTAIPCFLDLQSADGQALGLLSSPNAVVLRLRRRVKYRDNNLTTKLEVGIDTKDIVTDSESAVWWPSREGDTTMDSPRRCLAGEIHLNKILKPTTAIANFSIEYAVVLFSFDAPAFTSTGPDTLLIQPVEVATAYAPGPRPRIYSPPNYQPPVPVNPFYQAMPTEASLGSF